MKREYFNVCYAIAFLIMEITLIFTDFRGISSFGPRPMDSAGIIIIIAMIPRIVSIILAAVFSLLGYDQDSKQTRYFLITNLVLNLITLIVLIIIMQVKKDDIKEVNVLLRLWILLEIATKVIEPFDLLFTLLFEQSFFEYTQYQEPEDESKLQSDEIA